MYNSLEKELSSFFSFINVEVHELLKDAVCFALKILNKISLDTPERLIKAFNYRDWYCSYDVELFRKGLLVIFWKSSLLQISYFQTLTVVEKYLEMQNDF